MPEDGEYEVSNLGRVRSLTFRNRVVAKPYNPPRILTPQIQNNGYVTVSMRRKTVSVHRLVLLAFVGPCPIGCEAAHENGDRTDNRLENLSWKSKHDNAIDRDRHGTTYRGERHHLSKLTEQQVREIRQRYVSRNGRDFGNTQQLAREYGTTESNIYDITHNVTWKHVIAVAEASR